MQERSAIPRSMLYLMGFACYVLFWWGIPRAYYIPWPFFSPLKPSGALVLLSVVLGGAIFARMFGLLAWLPDEGSSQADRGMRRLLVRLSAALLLVISVTASISVFFLFIRVWLPGKLSSFVSIWSGVFLVVSAAAAGVAALLARLR